jgi:tetratricopeptide (TPR) repeat protein
VLGSEVETSQHATATRLAAALGYLPLAIDIGARLSRRAMVDIDVLAQALEESSPTEMLTDGSRSLHACFALSWDDLTAVQRRALISMVLLDAPSYDPVALATVNKLRKSHLQYLMGDLIARSLVAFTQSGRYNLHPMVRDFVLVRLAVGDPQETKAAGRLAASFYLEVVERDGSRQGGDREEAWHRTRTELENIVAAWKWSRANDEAELVMRFALSLGPYLMQRGYWSTGATLLDDGVAAAAEVADTMSALRLRLLRGELAREQGSYESAAQDIQHCLDAAPSMGREFEARAVRQLAELRRVERQYRESLRLHRISLAMSIEVDDLEGQMRSLHDCGLVERIVGEFDAAATHFQESVRMADLLNAASQRAYSWLEIGIVARSTDYNEEAALSLHRAMDFFVANYDLRGQSYTHRELGEVAMARGELDTALRHHTESLRLKTELRDRRGEAISRYYLAYTMQCMGRVEDARRMYELSIAASEELGDMRNVARIRLRMGEIRYDEGDVRSARRHWADAVSLFEHLGVTEKEIDVAREHLESTREG